MTTRFRIALLLPSLFWLVFLMSCSGTPFRPEASFDGDLSGREADSTVVLVGDTQRTSFWELLVFREQNNAPRHAVFKEIARENPGMVLLLGDLVTQGDDHREWAEFDDLTAGVRESHIPMYAVLGNHDYFGNAQVALDNFFRRFPHQQKRLWNSVRFKSVQFLLLNSNQSRMSREDIDAQNIWYRRQLEQAQADSTVTAIVVACHHPPFTNSRIVSCDEDVQRDFVGPYLRTPKAVLFFTGHCHSYEHFVQGGKQFVVSGGGGGPRQSVDCDAKRRRYADEYHGEEIRAFHFCRMTIVGDVLKVKMVKFDPVQGTWEVGDEFVAGQGHAVASHQ